MGKTLTGRFKPLNPSKYKGNPTNIVYRSSWELKFLSYLDKAENVIQYSSEEIIIWYKNKFDHKMHRYFPDMWVMQRDEDGVIREYMIEIKPYKQTQPPKKPTGKINRTFVNEAVKYEINTSKWAAARKYCEARNIQFVIMTEKDLFDKWRVYSNR